MVFVGGFCLECSEFSICYSYVVFTGVPTTEDYITSCPLTGGFKTSRHFPIGKRQDHKIGWLCAHWAYCKAYWLLPTKPLSTVMNKWYQMIVNDCQSQLTRSWYIISIHWPGTNEDQPLLNQGWFMLKLSLASCFLNGAYIYIDR